MGLKHKLLFLIVLGVMADNYAQQNKMDLGFTGGIGMRGLRGNEVLEEKNTSAFSFSGGIDLQYNISEKLALNTDLNFERKGAVANADQLDSSGNKTGTMSTFSNFDYLSLPLCIKFTLHKKVDFFVNAGGYLAYLLKQNFVIKESGLETKIADNTYKDKNLDWGLSIGFGLSKAIKKRLVLKAEIRNNLGLYNVSKVPVHNNGTIKTNNTLLRCGLTYKFISGD